MALRAFDGTAAQLEAWMQWGSYVSFDARAADDPTRFRELAGLVPPERLLLESGAPDRVASCLQGYPARADQVVFVADALAGALPVSRTGINAQLLFRR